MKYVLIVNNLWLLEYFRLHIRVPYFLKALIFEVVASIKALVHVLLVVFNIPVDI